MSVGLSIDQQMERWAQKRNLTAPTLSGPDTAAPASLSIDQQMERWAQKRNLTAPTFSTGPAAGFTKPSAAAKQESRVQELMREGGSYGTDWPIASGIHVGAKTAVDRFFVSPLVRLFDSEAADEINRESDALIEAHRRLADKGDGYDWQKWVGKQSVGISSSLTGMLGLAAGGSAAGLAKTGSAILMGAGFGVSEANESYTAGLDAGLSEDKAKAYAAKMGALETGVMMIFHGLGRVVPGLGGTEDLFIREGVAKRLVPSLIKESAVRTIGELTEENITSILQSITTAMDIPAAKGTDSWIGEDGTVWNSPMMDVVRQTTVQTLMTLGVVEAATGRGRYKQMQMIRNADRLSPEDFVILYPNEARQLAELDDSDLTRKKFVELSKLPTREGEGHEFQVKYKNDVKKAVLRRNAIENELQKPPDVTEAATDPEVGETGERVIPSEHATAAVGQMEEVQAPDVALQPEQFQEGRVAGTEEAREELSQVSPEAGTAKADADARRAAQEAAQKAAEEIESRVRREAQRFPPLETEMAVGDTVVREADGEEIEITGVGQRARTVPVKRRGRKTEPEPVLEEYYTYKDKKGVERTISQGAVGQFIKKAEAAPETEPESEIVAGEDVEPEVEETPLGDMQGDDLFVEYDRLKEEFSKVGVPKYSIERFGKKTKPQKVAALEKARLELKAKRMGVKVNEDMSTEEVAKAVAEAEQDEQDRVDAVPEDIRSSEQSHRKSLDLNPVVVVEVRPGRDKKGSGTSEAMVQNRAEEWVARAGGKVGVRVRIMDSATGDPLVTPAMMDHATGDIWVSRQYLREHQTPAGRASPAQLESYMKSLLLHEWLGHSLKRSNNKADRDMYGELLKVVREGELKQQFEKARTEYLKRMGSNKDWVANFHSLSEAKQNEVLDEEGLAQLIENMAGEWGLFSALDSQDVGLFKRLMDWFRRTYQGVFKRNKLYREIYQTMKTVSRNNSINEQFAKRGTSRAGVADRLGRSQPGIVQSLNDTGTGSFAAPRRMKRVSRAVGIRRDGEQAVGTGENGRVLINDVGRHLVSNHMETFGRAFDPLNNDDMEQAARLAADEIAYQMTQPESGEVWYDKDIAESMTLGAAIFEELATEPDSQYFLNIIAANLSPQTYAKQNWDKAMRAYEDFKSTGTIPHRNPQNGKLWAGTTGPNIAKSLRLLDHMHREMGTKGLAKWLVSPHTIAELMEVRRDAKSAAGKSVYPRTKIVRTDEIKAVEKRVSTLRQIDPEKKGLRTEAQEAEFKEKTALLSQLKRKAKRVPKKLTDYRTIKGPQDSLVVGAYIFGPKVGPFFLNVSGFDADTTADIWFTRMYMRHHGLLTSKEYGTAKATGLVDAPPETLRERMKEFNNRVAAIVNEVNKNNPKHRQMTARKAQSILWFFEQQLYNGLGTDTRSEKFSDGAKKFLEDKGRDPETERNRVRESRSGKAGGGVLRNLRRRSKRAEQAARDAGVSFAAPRKRVKPDNNPAEPFRLKMLGAIRKKLGQQKYVGLKQLEGILKNQGGSQREADWLRIPRLFIDREFTHATFARTPAVIDRDSKGRVNVQELVEYLESAFEPMVVEVQSTLDEEVPQLDEERLWSYREELQPQFGVQPQVGDPRQLTLTSSGVGSLVDQPVAPLAPYIEEADDPSVMHRFLGGAGSMEDSVSRQITGRLNPKRLLNGLLASPDHVIQRAAELLGVELETTQSGRLDTEPLREWFDDNVSYTGQPEARRKFAGIRGVPRTTEGELTPDEAEALESLHGWDSEFFPEMKQVAVLVEDVVETEGLRTSEGGGTSNVPARGGLYDWRYETEDEMGRVVSPSPRLFVEGNAVERHAFRSTDDVTFDEAHEEYVSEMEDLVESKNSEVVEEVERYEDEGPDYQQYSLNGDRDEYANVLFHVPSIYRGNQYESQLFRELGEDAKGSQEMDRVEEIRRSPQYEPHVFGEGVGFWMRYTVRDGLAPDGQSRVKVLFIEELQSDQAVDVRKERARQVASSLLTLPTRRIRRGRVARTEFPLSHELKQTGDVHSKKQDVWVEYALKWAVRHASENGYGRVEWTTAGQQAARGNAGEAVERVAWSLVEAKEEERQPQRQRAYWTPDYITVAISLHNGGTHQVKVDKDGNTLEPWRGEMTTLQAIVGGEMSKEIMAAFEGGSGDSKTSVLKNKDEGTTYVRTGDDWIVGKQGFAILYGQRLPRFAQALVEGHDTPALSAADSPITGGMTSGGHYTPGAQPGFNVTPSLRDHAMGVGYSMFAAPRKNLIRSRISPTDKRSERTDLEGQPLPPVDYDTPRANAMQRLETSFNEEEDKMIEWLDNPRTLTAEDTYVWRGVLEARALENLEKGDEESLRRNQALQLAWDEAGTEWHEVGKARQNPIKESLEEENFHNLVRKVTAPSEKSKLRVKKLRDIEKGHAKAESEAKGRLDTALAEAEERAGVAIKNEQAAEREGVPESEKRNARSAAEGAREGEAGARRRADKAREDLNRAKSQRSRSKEKVHKALSSDGKRAIETRDQLKLAGYETTEEGLKEIAADPIHNARAKAIAGTAREMDWVDRLLSARRNAMLSGIKTQAVNMFGPLMYVAEQQLPLILEAGLHHATGGHVGRMGFPALTRLWGGFYAHLGEASTNALISFRTGTQFFESEVMKKAGSSRAEAPTQAWEGLSGWTVETPQRLLGATDDFYKTVLTLSYLNAYAYQKFRDEKFTHEQAVDMTADVFEDHENPLWDEALVEAQRLTFTSRIDFAPLNLLRKMRQGDPNYRLPSRLEWARTPFKIATQTAVPFQDTPVNLLLEGMKQTPAGVIAELPNALINGDWSKVTSRGAQSLVGGMIAFALYNWVLGDDEEYPLITGTDIEHSPEKRELYNRRGMPQAQSFRVGDDWVSYERLDPLSTTLSLMVDAINAARRDDAGYAEMATVASQSLVRASLDKTFFSGIGDIAEAIRRTLDVRPGEDATNSMERGITHWSKGYVSSWVPTLFKHAKQASQKSYPERGIWGKDSEYSDRAMRRIAQGLEMGLVEDRPRVALFGEEIPRHSPWSNPALDWAWRFASPFRTKAHDPFVGNRIIMNWNRQNPKAQFNPRSPRQVSIDNTTIYLSDEQLEEYARLGGGYARKIIDYYENRGGFDDPANPTLKDKTIVQEAVLQGYREARSELWNKWNQDFQFSDKIISRKRQLRLITEEQERRAKQQLRSRRQYVSP